MTVMVPSSEVGFLKTAKKRWEPPVVGELGVEPVEAAPEHRPPPTALSGSARSTKRPTNNHRIDWIREGGDRNSRERIVTADHRDLRRPSVSGRRDFRCRRGINRSFRKVCLRKHYVKVSAVVCCFGKYRPRPRGNRKRSGSRETNRKLFFSLRLQRDTCFTIKTSTSHFSNISKLKTIPL